MKKLISKESVRLLFDLGIELLKTFKDIYESNKERTTNDEDTTQNINRNNQKDTNSSNTANNN